MTRDEYIVLFKQHLAHPFGGNGWPDPKSIPALFADFLRLESPEPWRRRRLKLGEPGFTPGVETYTHAWDDPDGDVIVRIACLLEADLAATARAVGYTSRVVLKRAHSFRPRIVPQAWSRAINAIEAGR